MQQVGLDTAELGAIARQAAVPVKAPRDRSKKRQTELVLTEGTRKSVRKERGANKLTDEESRLEHEVSGAPSSGRHNRSQSTDHGVNSLARRRCCVWRRR